MDTTKPDGDKAAYSEMIMGVRKSVTGLRELKQIKTFNDFYMTLPDAKQKVFVIHVYGFFGSKFFDHLLMVAKRSIYVLALGSKKGGWKQVADSTEFPIYGAVNFGFSGGYYGLPKGLGTEDVKVGFQELKYAIKRLIFGKPTSKDFLTVAFNICEAARYQFIFDQVLELIGKKGDRECRIPCEKSIFLARNWRKIALAIERVKKGKKWEFEENGNIIDGKKFVTQESVLELVRVIQKPSEEDEKTEEQEEDNKKKIEKQEPDKKKKKTEKQDK